MNADHIFGIMIFLILGPALIDNFLDFMVPGRWEKRAYKRSIEDLERKLRKRLDE